MTNFPEHLFKGTSFIYKDIRGDKVTLQFQEPFHGKPIVITFNGVVSIKGDPMDKETQSVGITNTVGFHVMTELQNLYQNYNEYAQLFISFKDGSELICGVKNLVIEELEPDNMVFRTRKIVMPADLNGADTLFGGKAFSLIDEEAYVYCACQLDYTKLVTVGVSAMNFTSPAKESDIIEIGCDVVRFGKSSITVKAVIRNKTTKKDICVVDEITFVALDEAGNPKLHGKTTKKEY